MTFETPAGPFNSRNIVMPPDEAAQKEFERKEKALREEREEREFGKKFNPTQPIAPKDNT